MIYLDKKLYFIEVIRMDERWIIFKNIGFVIWSGLSWKVLVW